MTDELKITKSSGNVFADLGRPNPEELLLKSRLTQRIAKTLTEREWTQAKAAKVLGINQSDVSNLVRGKRLSHYSLEKLLGFLSVLGYQVTLAINVAHETTPTQVNKHVELYSLEPSQVSPKWRDVLVPHAE